MAAEAFSDWIKNTALVLIAASLMSVAFDVSKVSESEKQLLELQIEERELSIQLLEKELKTKG